jgi:hypothetical protein
MLGMSEIVQLKNLMYKQELIQAASSFQHKTKNYLNKVGKNCG